ncbi:E3 ubiquitin/ISG15 ligase TRIM25-like [Heterodontus francisci]|uniref:E3 ubiquitin/ISG15 ligase TRIM25-like n=1 Tax=Heterodontus francisci TaxID=7792 RepID=UPI00355C0D1B
MMAQVADGSVMEAELTCAVCLDLFREPVTAPCGHNFCRACLAQFWAGDRRRLLGFTCPQCRAHFVERPELHPNRVLCAVVEEFERSRATLEPPEPVPERSVPCDACPAGGASAVRTCLTCLASFCSEHLEPHHLSPAFRSHNLTAPLTDLAQRRCPQHDKLLEFYCAPHRRCICAACLLEHRGCDTQSIEKAQAQQEEELKSKQKGVRYQIIQLQHSLELVQYQKQHLQDSSVKQKSSLSGEFNEMKTLIEEEEKIAVKMIEEEESKASSQILGVLDKITVQLNQLKEYQEHLDSALSDTGGMVFWKNIAELPVISLDVHTPPEPMELDVSKVEFVEKAVSVLKQVLMRQLKCPLQERVKRMVQAEKPKLKPKQQPVSASDQEDYPSSPSDPMEPASASNSASSQATNPLEGKLSKKKKTKQQQSPHQQLVSAPDQGECPRKLCDTSTLHPLSRQDFMQYNSKVTLDHRTAHKKLVISNLYTSLAIADQPQSYPDTPERFFNCSQALGLQSFTNGRRYWEVTTNGSSFWAIGIACIGMDRRGSRSRLGRNPLSWCVESFGQKLSAWHGDREFILSGAQPRVVGVYLDFEAGFVAFYSVTNTMLLLFKYKADFQGRVFPAFWLCSSGTKLTLGQ